MRRRRAAVRAATIATIISRPRSESTSANIRATTIVTSTCVRATTPTPRLGVGGYSGCRTHRGGACDAGANYAGTIRSPPVLSTRNPRNAHGSLVGDRPLPGRSRSRARRRFAQTNRRRTVKHTRRPRSQWQLCSDLLFTGFLHYCCPFEERTAPPVAPSVRCVALDAARCGRSQLPHLVP